MYIYHRTGNIRWDLNLDNGTTHIDSTQYVPLSMGTAIDDALDFNWNILWRPEFLDESSSR